MDEKRRYRVSVMGDSISTYQGYNPIGAKVYYKDDVATDNGLESVNDTWWKIVIDGIGATLCVNNSHSGSLVAGVIDECACSEYRCSHLHDENMPDLILIYMGTNDRGYGVEIGNDEPDNVLKFYGAYRTMLKNVKRNYPDAKIICATLLLGCLQQSAPLPTRPPFKDSVDVYNETIRTLAKEENCLLADLAAFNVRYETQDFLHPNKNGHRTMANLWLESLKLLHL